MNEERYQDVLNTVSRFIENMERKNKELKARNETLIMKISSLENEVKYYKNRRETLNLIDLGGKVETKNSTRSQKIY